MNATILFAVTVVLFAIALTAYASMIVGLARKAPRWRAAIAAIFPPLGAAWSIREHMWFRAAAWTAGTVGYVVARALQ